MQQVSAINNLLVEVFTAGIYVKSECHVIVTSLDQLHRFTESRGLTGDDVTKAAFTPSTCSRIQVSRTSNLCPLHVDCRRIQDLSSILLADTTCIRATCKHPVTRLLTLTEWVGRFLQLEALILKCTKRNKHVQN